MLLHCGSGYIALSTIVDYFQKTNHEMIPSRPNLPSVLVAIVSDRCSIRRLSTLTQRQVYQPQKRFIEVIACTEAAEEAKVLDSQHRALTIATRLLSYFCDEHETAQSRPLFVLNCLRAPANPDSLLLLLRPPSLLSLDSRKR